MKKRSPIRRPGSDALTSRHSPRSLKAPVVSKPAATTSTMDCCRHHSTADARNSMPMGMQLWSIRNAAASTPMHCTSDTCCAISSLAALAIVSSCAAWSITLPRPAILATLSRGRGRRHSHRLSPHWAPTSAPRTARYHALSCPPNLDRCQCPIAIHCRAHQSAPGTHLLSNKDSGDFHETHTTRSSSVLPVGLRPRRPLRKPQPTAPAQPLPAVNTRPPAATKPEACDKTNAATR